MMDDTDAEDDIKPSAIVPGGHIAFLDVHIRQVAQFFTGDVGGVEVEGRHVGGMGRRRTRVMAWPAAGVENRFPGEILDFIGLDPVEK